MRRDRLMAWVLVGGLGLAGLQVGCLSSVDPANQFGLLGLLAGVPQDLFRVQEWVLGGNAERLLLVQAEQDPSSFTNLDVDAPIPQPTVRYSLLDLRTGRASPYSSPAPTTALAYGIGPITDGRTIAWLQAEYVGDSDELIDDPSKLYIGVADIDSGATQRLFEGLRFEGAIDVGPPLAVSDDWLILTGNEGPGYAPATIVVNRATGEQRRLAEAVTTIPGGLFGQQSFILGDELFLIGPVPLPPDADNAAPSTEARNC